MEPDNKLELDQPSTWEFGLELRAFNGAIRRRRKLLGLTQKQLAERVGVSNVSIALYENLRQRPLDTTLAKLAEILGCTCDELWPPWLEVFTQSRIVVTKQITAQEMSALSSSQRQGILALPAPKETSSYLDLIDTTEILAGALKRLSQRERRVLEARYGLGGAEQLSLDKTAKLFNVTGERIRQIEIRALRKLSESEPIVSKIAEEVLDFSACPTCATMVGRFEHCSACQYVACRECVDEHKCECESERV